MRSTRRRLSRRPVAGRARRTGPHVSASKGSSASAPEFWREVGFSTTLAEFRAAYESRLGAPITVFFPRDDHSVLLGAGRYLLSVRVPLTPSDAPVEAWIVPEG